MSSDEEQKTFRKLALIIWFALATLNLIITIHSGSSIGWFLTGFLFGGAVIMLMDHSLMNIQDKFTNSQDKYIKWLLEINRLYNEKINEYLSKKVKGGKRKKK